MMSESVYWTLYNCLNSTKNESHYCHQLVIPKLLPKFLILNLKSSEVEVKSELMIHDPSKYRYLTVYTGLQC